jgi:hypothetical protein
MASKTEISPDDDSSHVRIDLFNAPKIGSELGNMCAAWAAMEWRIFALFLVITGIPVVLARATFYSHFNSRARSELLLTVARAVLVKRGKLMPEFDQLEKILSKVNDSAKKRNDYIHNPWCAWDELPHEVFQMKLSEKRKYAGGHPVKERDLVQLSNQINKLGKELYDLYLLLVPQLPALRRKLDKQPTLPLEFPSRYLAAVRRAKQPRPPPS